MLAFGGIVFLLVILVAAAIAVWAVLAYARAGAKAADEGIDREQDNPDAGHV
jgi:hypothetical protein